MTDIAAAPRGRRWRIIVDTRTGVTILNVTAFLLLQGCYSLGLAGVFQGYEPAFEPLNFVFGLALTVLLTQLFPPERRVSRFFMHFGMVSIVIPTLVLNSNGKLPLEFVALTVAAFVLVGLSARIRMTPPLFKWQWRLTPISMLWLLVAASIPFLGGLVVFGGARLNFNLAAVYELRSEAENLPTIYRYLIPIFAQAVLPFGMVLAIVKNRWVMLGAFIAISVLIFALTGHKGPLFYPLLVVGVYYLAAVGRVSLLFSAFVIVCLAVSLYDLVLYADGQSPFDGWIGALVVDRVLMLPNLLNFFFWDFFTSGGAFYYWSDSRITFGLLDMPYNQMSPELIGATYFPNIKPYANVGWIGSGISEAGIAGVFVYSIGLGLIFSFADAVATRFGTRVALALFVIHASNLLNSIDFVQSFLTGGVLISILLVMMTGASPRWTETHRSPRAGVSP